MKKRSSKCRWESLFHLFVSGSSLWVTKFCADPNECYFYNLSFDTFELNSDRDTRFEEIRVLMWAFRRRKLQLSMINVCSVTENNNSLRILLGILSHGSSRHCWYAWWPLHGVQTILLFGYTLFIFPSGHLLLTF